MSENSNPFDEPEESSNPFEETGDTDTGFDSFNQKTQEEEEGEIQIDQTPTATIHVSKSESFNPFDEPEETSNQVEETSDTDPGFDSFTHQQVQQQEEVRKIHQINQTATIQIEEKKTLQNIPTYTSLEEEQVNTIMRSVSMDDAETLGQKKELSDSNDLVVKVDSPEKHVEGYVSYSVTTQTTREGFENYDFKVRRRFQDFLWLKHQLQEEYPTHIIPPLPEKFTFTKHMVDKYDPDFLKTRQKALDKFMSRIVEHPVLSFSDNLKTFLSAKAWEMTTARKKGPGTASKVGGSVKNTAAQMMMKNRDEEFEESNQYINAFQAKVKNFATIADQIARERFFLLDDLTEYGSAFRLWSNSESKLAETLNTVAESVDKKCENLKSILRVHELRFCEPLREYILYCDSVKLASRKRDQIQIEHELVLEELAKRRAEKEEVESGQAKSFSALFGKDPEKAKEERLVKINQQIQDLLSESESLSNNRTTADEDFRADIERWNKSKMRDMKALLIEIADRHIKLHDANINAWQTSLEVISKPRKMHSGLE